jgi:hypothetical protein
MEENAPSIMTPGCQVHVSPHCYLSPIMGSLPDAQYENVAMSTKVNPSDPSALKIAGFGACMIGGFPHESGGLLEVACALVEKELSRSVARTILTLHSFTAPRAEKFLKSRIAPLNPDYVIVQFGSTDVARPIRSKRRSSGAVSKERTVYHTPNAFTIFRWHMQSLVGFVWKTAPRTSLSSYIVAIEHMVNDCIWAEITPVVLSPFVFGSHHSLKNAADYTDALRDLHSRYLLIAFVFCRKLPSQRSCCMTECTSHAWGTI